VHVVGAEPLAAVVLLAPAAVVLLPVAVVPVPAVVGDVADAFDFAADDPHAARSINIGTTMHLRKRRTRGS